MWHKQETNCTGKKKLKRNQRNRAYVVVKKWIELLRRKKLTEKRT
ncbi:MAG TPA: hypothetical protein VIP70_07210 [Nitrososphaeraceae archaeon]